MVMLSTFGDTEHQWSICFSPVENLIIFVKMWKFVEGKLFIVPNRCLTSTYCVSNQILDYKK